MVAAVTRQWNLKVPVSPVLIGSKHETIVFWVVFFFLLVGPDVVPKEINRKNRIYVSGCCQAFDYCTKHQAVLVVSMND